MSEERKIQERQGWNELGIALVVCALFVVIVRSFVFDFFKIPSSSMVPTLQIGDYIFASKFSYAWFIPLTEVELVRWGEPKRGEVIVFLSPADKSLYYVKRVIGVPGDEIEFQGKALYVNGKLLVKERVTNPDEIRAAVGSGEFTGELYRETIDDHHYYVRHLENTSYNFSRNQKVRKIPSGEYFVVGDNRDDSYDSRGWGNVPLVNIRSRARVVWLSLDYRHGWDIRWRRAGTLIP